MTGVLIVLDSVLSSIATHVLGHRPERGGALMGASDVSLVTEFVPDPYARSTRVSWQASDHLRQAVRDIEVGQGVENLGIVHSHPRWLARPSGGDKETVAEALGLNPHMGSYLAPIAVHRRAYGSRGHETAAGIGCVAWYRMIRSRTAPVRVVAEDVHVLPVEEHMRALAAGLSIDAPIFGPILLRSGHRIIADLGSTHDALIAFPLDYPLSPPLLVRGSDSGTEMVTPQWSDSDDPVATILDLIEGHSNACPPVPDPAGTAGAACHVEGGADGPDRLDHPHPAEDDNGLGQDLAGSAGAVARRGIAARVEELVGSTITDRTVLIAGAGSVGSHLADLLVRSGVEHLIVVDPDIVEPANLSRSIYTSHQIGRPKVDALAEHLVAINPVAQIVPLAVRLEDLSAEDLIEILDGTDLVVGATDDLATQRTLDRFAYAAGVAGIWPGIHERGRSGEVLVTVPELTPCFRCATAVREVDDGPGAAVNYGSGRLVAEIALGADIVHITAAAAKLALAVLSAETDSPLRHLVIDAIASRQTFLTISTTPNHWFFPHVFDGVAGQHAFQSVWLSPEVDPACAVCGDADGRIDPATVPMNRPDPNKIKI